MANSESDSKEPKDDQAETPEDHEEPSDADHSDVEEAEDTSPDGQDADGESTDEHTDDEKDRESDESDSDDETVEASDDGEDESDSDDETVDTSDDEDESDSDDEKAEASDQGDESEAEDGPSDDDPDQKASDDGDGSTSGGEDDSAESDDASDEDAQNVSHGDDHEETSERSDDGNVLMTERFVDDATGHENSTPGIAAFFDHPDDLMDAARRTRDSEYAQFDAFSPFPIHGMDEAMGLGRSWIPWVTFGAGLFGFLCAVALEFGTMTFDWPMIIGGKPFAPWPAFVPVMFELTVLIGGVTTGVVMLKAAGCFQPAEVIDPDLTNDRFALWISADDAAYDRDEVVEFVRSMNPTEVRTFTEKADSDA